MTRKIRQGATLHHFSESVMEACQQQAIADCHFSESVMEACQQQAIADCLG